MLDAPDSCEPYYKKRDTERRCGREVVDRVHDLIGLGKSFVFCKIMSLQNNEGICKGLALEESFLMLNGEWFSRQEHELGRQMGMNNRWPMTWTRVARLEIDTCGQILGSNMQVELTGFADFSLGTWVSSQLRCFSCLLFSPLLFFFIFLCSFVCSFIPSLFSSIFFFFL